MYSRLVALSGLMVVACGGIADQEPHDSYQKAYDAHRSEIQEITNQLGSDQALARIIVIDFARFGTYSRHCDTIYDQYDVFWGIAPKVDRIPGADYEAVELLNQLYRKTYDHYFELVTPTWPTPDSCQAVYAQYQESSRALDNALCSISTLSEDQLQNLYDAGMRHNCN